MNVLYKYAFIGGAQELFTVQSTLVNVRGPWSVRERPGLSESKSADGACQALTAGTPAASCNSSFTCEAIKTHRHYESARGRTQS